MVISDRNVRSCQSHVSDLRTSGLRRLQEVNLLIPRAYTAQWAVGNGAVCLTRANLLYLKRGRRHFWAQNRKVERSRTEKWDISLAFPSGGQKQRAGDIKFMAEVPVTNRKRSLASLSDSLC
ncbi:hypothetical protein NPIL_615111 [Nephila pilipes]|uniref:Uncharacterized protein n=1 Tax=Nephila pilipes TaxID=299642 RepID=A0A8X6Q613_NEPPI|nr:hypothetical protein NPIL_615111 [Nephila pilipes]